MQTQGIFLSWIIVKNIKEAIKFYTEVCGLELKEFHEEYRWAELSGPNGCALGIGEEGPESEIKPGANAVVTITVKDLNEAIAHFNKKGATLIGDVIEVPGHVKMQTFSDKDGNTMQIVELLGDHKTQ